jgi:hypothetical protein
MVVLVTLSPTFTTNILWKFGPWEFIWITQSWITQSFIHILTCKFVWIKRWHFLCFRHWGHHFSSMIPVCCWNFSSFCRVPISLSIRWHLNMFQSLRSLKFWFFIFNWLLNHSKGNIFMKAYEDGHLILFIWEI